MKHSASCEGRYDEVFRKKMIHVLNRSGYTKSSSQWKKDSREETHNSKTGKGSCAS